MKSKLCLYVAMLFITGCGPGVADYEQKIANGYYFSDAGYYETTIINKNGNEQGGIIVVDAKVAGWLLHENTIYVARNPRLISIKNYTPSSKLSNKCEYWKIDIKSEVVNGPYHTTANLFSPKLPANEMEKLQC